MTNLSEFQRMAQLARRERVPRVNVTSQVMAAIHRSRYRVARVDSPVLVFAGVALAAAALVAIWAVPAFPGATHKRVTRGDCLIFQAMACSLPPEPTINIFILQTPIQWPFRNLF